RVQRRLPVGRGGREGRHDRGRGRQDGGRRDRPGPPRRPGHHRRREPAPPQNRPHRRHPPRRPDRAGVGLRRADQARPVPQGVLLGRRAGGGVMAFVNQLPIGLSIGAVLLLVALGLTVTFGQMGVINMAHGEFIMAGAYTAFLIQDLLLALPAAFLVAGLMGLALERGLIRRFYGRPLDTLLLTWGVSLVLQQLARDLFGAPNVQVSAPSWLSGGVGILPYHRLFI